MVEAGASGFLRGSTPAPSASPRGGWEPDEPARRTRSVPARRVVCLKKSGDEVDAGEPLLELHADDPARFDGALKALEGAVDIASEPGEPSALVLERDRSVTTPDRSRHRIRLLACRGRSRLGAHRAGARSRVTARSPTETSKGCPPRSKGTKGVSSGIGSGTMSSFSRGASICTRATRGGVTYPMRLAIGAGCDTIILTNAAGGINDELEVGAPCLIGDHLNLTGQSPLLGPNDDAGPRFLDLTEVYDESSAPRAHHRPRPERRRLRRPTGAHVRDARRGEDAPHAGSATSSGCRR